VGNFAHFLDEDFDQAATCRALRKAESIGRPIRSDDWLDKMEKRTGRRLKRQKRGPVKGAK